MSGLGEAWGTHGMPTNSRAPAPKELGSYLRQSLDGFVFVVASDGKITYISESASTHLGLKQVELIGTSIFDCIHPDDVDDTKKVLTLYSNEIPNENRSSSRTVEIKRKFVFRMKCVLGKREAGLTSDGYKVIHCSGYLKAQIGQSNNAYEGGFSGVQNLGLVGIGHSLPSPKATEIKITDSMFMYRASMDLKVLYSDER